MLSDIIRQSGISLSHIPNLTSIDYGASGRASSAGVISTLDSITFPTDAFGTVGDFMSFEYWGGFFGDADTQLNLDVVSDHIFTSGIMDPGGEGWLLHGKTIRLNNTSDLPVLRTVATLVGQTIQIVDTSSAVIDIVPGGSMTVVLKGGGTSASSVVLYSAFRQFYFQNR